MFYEGEVRGRLQLQRLSRVTEKEFNDSGFSYEPKSQREK